MYRVLKRDGSMMEFHIAKIGNAITKAFEAVGRQYHPSVIELLALRVTAEFEPKIRNDLISVEDIQDCVERVLSEAGYSDVAKAYILYRKQREKLRNVGSTLLNYKELVDNYLKINDWRVKENSTVTYSVGGLILSNSGAITANYWLSEIYDAEIAQAHRNADLHLHDLSMLTGYCAGWSLRQLIQEGLGGVPGKISSSPASHLSTLCNQMVNFLGIMQNEWAGAQAFSSFDTYLAPFVRVDKLTQREVKQCVQSFVYGVNTPSRWGTQAPFSNITLDWVVPSDLAQQPAIISPLRFHRLEQYFQRLPDPGPTTLRDQFQQRRVGFGIGNQPFTQFGHVICDVPEHGNIRIGRTCHRGRKSDGRFRRRGHIRDCARCGFG